jgi:hypothetical protein
MSSPAKDSAKKDIKTTDADAKAAGKKSTLELLEEDDEFQEFDGKYIIHAQFWNL